MRSIHFRTTGLAASAGAAIALTTASVVATQTTARVRVSDARPLSAAIAELETRHGSVVTYEDPLRINSSDVADVTDTIPPERRTKPRILVARGGEFTFDYETPSDNSNASVMGMLQQLVQQYNRASADATFRVMRTSETFQILPEVSKDTVGNLQAAGLPLDTIISIPGGQRTAWEQLWAIRTALREAGFSRFSMGAAPMGALSQPANWAAHEGPARAAVVRVLESSPNKLSYRLNCSPGWNPTCVLNLHPLMSAKK